MITRANEEVNPWILNARSSVEVPTSVVPSALRGNGYRKSDMAEESGEPPEVREEVRKLSQPPYKHVDLPLIFLSVKK